MSVPFLGRRAAKPAHRVPERECVLLEFGIERREVHHEHPGVPQKFPPDHPARRDERRLFDEAHDLQASSHRAADLLVAVSGLRAIRNDADHDERPMRRGKACRVGQRAAKRGGRCDVVIRGYHGDDAGAGAMLDNGASIGDRDRGAVPHRLDNQVGGRNQAAERRKMVRWSAETRTKTRRRLTNGASRSTVSPSGARRPSIENSGLGRQPRLSGQKRVPRPPAITSALSGTARAPRRLPVAISIACGYSTMRNYRRLGR